MKNLILEEKLTAGFNFLENKKIFVTGGTGFFGKSLLDVIGRFAQDISFDMVVLSRDPASFLNQNKQFADLKNVRFHQGDITNFKFLNEKFDAVLHFATPADAKLNIENPLLMTSIISDGMKRILDFTIQAEVKDFLFASSGAVYGAQPIDLTHTPETYSGAPHPHALDAAYGEAKRYAELTGCLAARQHGFNFKTARCFAFTGPYLNQDGSFAIANFIKDALANVTIQIKGDGTPYRSYLYADDLIAWLLTILKSGKSGQPYNVGSDQDLTIGELAYEVVRTLNPNVTVNIHQKAKEDAKPTRYVPNIQKAKLELGLDAWTPLQQAIQLSAKKINR